MDKKHNRYAVHPQRAHGRHAGQHFDAAITFVTGFDNDVEHASSSKADVEVIGL
ncbi:MAG: hypothetical protein QNI91_14095 [Arenicellales bacterium]|nr:hypothetical protein [Arenicellales bacterium]